MKNYFKRLVNSWKKKDLDPKIDTTFEKGDITAILIAAFITIVPVVLLIMGMIYLIIYLLFLR